MIVLYYSSGRARQFNAASYSSTRANVPKGSRVHLEGTCESQLYSKVWYHSYGG